MFKTIFKGAHMYTLHSKHKVPERHVLFTVLALMIITAVMLSVPCQQIQNGIAWFIAVTLVQLRQLLCAYGLN